MDAVGRFTRPGQRTMAETDDHPIKSLADLAVADTLDAIGAFFVRQSKLGFGPDDISQAIADSTGSNGNLLTALAKEVRLKPGYGAEQLIAALTNGELDRRLLMLRAAEVADPAILSDEVGHG